MDNPRKREIGPIQPAANRWEKLKTARPPEGEQVLIYANYGGLETYDVAFYEGKREDGSDWWIMSNVEIPTNRILFWAFINETSND